MSHTNGTFFPSGRRIGLGCMGYSWGYSRPGQLDDTASLETIRQAYEAGIRHFDTSDMYASGHNESLVGEALKDLQEAKIATKGGIVVDSIQPLRMHLDGSKKHLKSAIDKSLDRLKRESIDLYYLHRIDPQFTIQEQLETLGQAQQEGKIKQIGLSEPTVDQLEIASEITEISAVQSELSVWTRDPLNAQIKRSGTQQSVLEWCEKHNATFVAFSPLGRGYLTGKLDTSELLEGDFRTWMPRFTSNAQAQNKAILETLTNIANNHGVTPSQIALAWALEKSPVISVIPGSRSLSHIKANLEAQTIHLTPQETKSIDQLPEPEQPRY